MDMLVLYVTASRYVERATMMRTVRRATAFSMKPDGTSS
jgi:hypothetical protein